LEDAPDMVGLTTKLGGLAMIYDGLLADRINFVGAAILVDQLAIWPTYFFFWGGGIWLLSLIGHFPTAMW
jgi:hypothetical protein